MDRFDETTAALEYECPECGVAVGKRCRKEVSVAWTKTKREVNGLRPATQYQHVKPHPDRVLLAWRVWLKAQDAQLAAGRT